MGEHNIQQVFLKYTAQQIKFYMLDNHIDDLQKYKSTHADRQYQFWERRPYSSTMYNRKVASQKIDYMHRNPVKAGLCKLPEEYYHSSARFYELNTKDDLLTHYADHL